LGVADRVRVLRPEQVEPDVHYNEIWSNPPIRIGKQGLHELLLGWLARLAPDGVARLVVGKNLGSDTLQRWLIEQGYGCERVASSKGFRVLVVRPGPEPR
jgi:16S rRNA G1207 methylase RsmC